MNKEIAKEFNLHRYILKLSVSSVGICSGCVFDGGPMCLISEKYEDADDTAIGCHVKGVDYIFC